MLGQLWTIQTWFHGGEPSSSKRQEIYLNAFKVLVTRQFNTMAWWVENRKKMLSIAERVRSNTITDVTWKERGFVGPGKLASFNLESIQHGPVSFAEKATDEQELSTILREFSKLCPKKHCGGSQVKVREKRWNQKNARTKTSSGSVLGWSNTLRRRTRKEPFAASNNFWRMHSVLFRNRAKETAERTLIKNHLKARGWNRANQNEPHYSSLKNGPNECNEQQC